MQKVEMIYDGDQPKKPDKATEKTKLPFLAPFKITDTMTEDQKKFFSNYNMMQKEHIKNGTMETK